VKVRTSSSAAQPGANQAQPPPVARPLGRVAAVARLRDLALVPAILLILIVGYLVNPVFLHRENLVNVLQQQSAISLVVLAEAIVLISGKFDLSLESTYGLAPGVAAWLILPTGLTHGLGWKWPGALAIPIALAVAVVEFPSAARARS
jgi:simple sugar transport system permease protein